MWVVAGYGEDADVGSVVRFENEHETVAVVAWESGVQTTLNLMSDDVRLFTNKSTARAICVARQES